MVNPSIPLADFDASYTFKDAILRRVAIVYDLSNRAYSEEFAVNFKLAFERLGGETVSTDTFTAEPDVSFKNLPEVVLRAKPHGLLRSEWCWMIPN